MAKDKLLAGELEELKHLLEIFTMIYNRRKDIDSAWVSYRRLIAGYSTELSRLEITEPPNPKGSYQLSRCTIPAFLQLEQKETASPHRSPQRERPGPS
eukprot:8741217-Pyramimonas_sp.AAC.1